jgi:small-conductance mechanosensitive channel
MTMGEIIAWLDQRHGAIFASAVVLAIAGLSALLVKRLVKSWLLSIQTRLQLADATVLGVMRVVTGLIWLIALLSILNAWGIALAGLWGVLVSAIAVIGVGFLATWAMISNFTASFFLAIWRPFRLGDTIVLLPENTTGRVTGRNLMFTVISEQDGSVVNVPNNFFFQKMFRVLNTQAAVERTSEQSATAGEEGSNT